MRYQESRPEKGKIAGYHLQIEKANPVKTGDAKL
jgi:hypothetical protein